MLDRYRAILSGKIQPYYLEAKKKGVHYLLKKEGELWALHEDIVEKEVPPLTLKSELAHRMLEHCTMCEWRCGVDRFRGELGMCGVDAKSKLSSVFLHFGEEQVLVPSHTVFFAGCNLKCVYCQNYDISQRPEDGSYVRPQVLAERLDHGGGRNVNWVGGDPTPNMAYILEVLECMEESLPQVWNSNLYLSKEGMHILAKLMDVYLTDFKYGNDECALRLSGVKDYTHLVKRNHIIAERTGDLMIRHLVLPGHIECCTKPILEWIRENLETPRVNIMTQYRPEYKANGYKDISGYLTSDELDEVERLREIYSGL